MSEYKLTTQQVEDGFSHEPEYEYSNPIDYGAHVQSNRRAFRRWLAEVERAAAEKALREYQEALRSNNSLWAWGPDDFLYDIGDWADTYRQKDS